MIHCNIEASAARRCATVRQVCHSERMHPVRDSIAGMLGDLLRAQPASQAKLDFAWRTVAGPAMARATRVEMDARGTLRVFAPDPNWRREVRRSQQELQARLAALLGERVSRVTVTK
jgi:hypothetical protein